MALLRKTFSICASEATPSKKYLLRCYSFGLLSGAVLWTSEVVQRLDAGTIRHIRAKVFTDLDKSRDDHLHRLVNDLEAVGVVQTHDIGSHEGEDGHDVVQHLLLQGGVDESDDDESMVGAGNNKRDE